MTGQLKKGEKACAHVCTHLHTQVRMMVNKELPKLLEKLRDAVHEYETTLGLQLKVEGERIIDVLDAADESSEAAKHEAQVCVCAHMYVCMYVYMLYARSEAATHDTSEQNVSVCEHTRVYACAYAHAHTRTQNRHARWRNR